MRMTIALTSRFANVYRIGLIAATLLVVSALTPSARGQSETESGTSPVGLKGLLPAEPPSRLVEALGRLPETWKAWTEGTLGELNALYAETPNDVAGQQAALARLKARIATIDRSLADSRYNSIRNELIEARGMLLTRVDLLDAVLHTLTDVEARTDLNSTRQSLLASLNSLNAFLAPFPSGRLWNTYLRTAEVGQELATESNVNATFTAQQRSLKNLHHARVSNDSVLRDFCERPVLIRYLVDLDRAVKAHQRAIAGIQWPEVRTNITKLLDALEQYEDGQLLSAANAARVAYEKLRDLTPDGGDRLTMALRRHYFDSNFQASLSEGFLQRITTMTRAEAGPVRDFILGADVYGNQTTSSISSVSVVPSNSGAHLQVQLHGDVASSTEAYASRAVIYSNGSQHFDGFKDVYFDGHLFSTAPAMLNVTAYNQPVGASTQADRIPILAGIARRIALRTANRNRPETEAIAAQRVDSRVLPQFNAEVDSRFAQLNVDLQNKVAGPLKSEQLFPDYLATRSTDSDLILNTRLMSAGKLGGGVPSPVMPGPEDAVLSVHQSMLNNALDLLPIAGKTMTEPELEQLIQQKVGIFFPKLNLQKERTTTAATEPDETDRIMFAETDPLRIRFEDGNLLLTIRAGFERTEDRGGNIPPQVITIPLVFTLAGNEIVATRGDISIAPVSPAENVATQLVLSGVIKSRMAKSFPETARSASTFDIDRGTRTLHLRLTELTISGGWLSVRAREDLPSQP